MQFLADIPIKRKLTWVIMFTSAGGLIAATVALFAYQVMAFRQGFLRDLDVLAKVTANLSTGAVSFNSKSTANEIVAALEAKSNIVSAVIQLDDGSEFARFGGNQEGFGDMPRSGHKMDRQFLLYAQPIVLNAAHLGTPYLRAEYDRPFYALVRAHLGTLAAVLLGSILVTLVLSTQVQRIISDPILRLADTAKSVAEKKDYSARAVKVGRDELGLFTDAFNQMLTQIQVQDSALKKTHEELQERFQALQHEIAERERAEQQLEIAHRDLVDASRRAGMAEVATGVLHNVGNVLNSVNVSAILLLDTVRKSEGATLVKMAKLLQEHEHDLAAFLTQDDRGRHVIQLLHGVAEQLAGERANLQGELDLLAKNIEHIKNIVAMQQNYASVAGLIERVNLDALVEDALEINAAALVRHGVEVSRQFEPLPPILVDKHKVLQVLVNLIQNAKYALAESGRREKQLSVQIGRNGANSVRIVVDDNGVGIAPENLTRIFGHGFTTRKQGHGFGLHASALAAREMRGSLNAQSEGLGKGARFVLELPVLPKETASS